MHCDIYSNCVPSWVENITLGLKKICVRCCWIGHPSVRKLQVVPQVHKVLTVPIIHYHIDVPLPNGAPTLPLHLMQMIPIYMMRAPALNYWQQLLIVILPVIWAMGRNQMVQAPWWFWLQYSMACEIPDFLIRLLKYLSHDWFAWSQWVIIIMADR